MNFKKPTAALFVLLLINITLSTEVPPKPEGKDDAAVEKPKLDKDGNEIKVDTTPPKQVCHKEVMGGLGLKGNEHATELELAMCPEVSESCCTVEDQLTLFDQWVTDKQEHNLKRRFAFHTEVLFFYLYRCGVAYLF